MSRYKDAYFAFFKAKVTTVRFPCPDHEVHKEKP